MANEVAAHGMSIGGRHGHLADALDEGHAHGHQGGAVAIVQMKKIESGAAAFFDLEAQTGVERFFAGAANPEIALA